MAMRQPPSVLAYERIEHTARNDRLSLGAVFTPHASDPLASRSGALIGPPGANAQVSLPDQGTLRIEPGIFILQGQVDAAQGQYVAINDSDYDTPILTEQHGSQFRQVAVVAYVLDSVMAGVDPITETDPETGDPILDPETGEPVQTFAEPTNVAGFALVEGDLSPVAPGFPPDITSDEYQAYAVLGWITVPPVGQQLSYTRNPAAVVGLRGGILPVLAGDDLDGPHKYAYRHHPDEGLQYWNGSAWRSMHTREHLSDRIRLTSLSDASTSSTFHAFQIGPSDGANLIADTNEVLARNAGAIAELNLGRPVLTEETAWDLAAPTTPGNALATKAHIAAVLARTKAVTFRLSSQTEATEDSADHAFQIGENDSYNLRFDSRRLIAFADGAPANVLLHRPVATPGSFNLAADTTPGNAYVTKDYVNPAIRDSGWTSLGPAGGWTGIGEEGGVKYRVVGGVCFLRLAVSRASWAADAVVLTIPELWRPSIPQTYTAHWGNAAYELRLNASGPLLVKRAGTGGLVSTLSWPIG